MRNRLLSVLLVLAVAGFMAAVSADSQAPPPRKVIKLPATRANAPFSDAIQVGGTVYLAGTLGLDPATQQPPADVEQEAKLMLDSFKAKLTAVNMTMDDLATVTVYCSDVAHYDAFNKVYVTYFKKDLPARAFIGSGKLLRGARFEIQGIAVK